MSRDFREWVLWSVGVPIEVPDVPGDPERERLKRAIGSDRARRVLTALAAHANDDGRAFPSVKTLMDLTNLNRWTVRDALDYLAAAGVIRSVGTRARGVVEWLMSPGVDARPGGDPRHMAGDMAGDLAGDLAGTPDAEREREREFRASAGSSGMTATDADDRLELVREQVEANLGGFDSTGEETVFDALFSSYEDDRSDSALVRIITNVLRKQREVE